jgi:hypothetical protein
MGRRIILHIGGEKTGTTTLQKYLFRNAAILRQRSIHYFNDRSKPYVSGVAHFPLAACLISEEVDFIPDEKRVSLSRALSALEEDIRQLDGTIILSCEHFSSRLRSRDQLQRLRDALASEDVHVVCYAREQSELALSSWSTAVRYGCDQKFSLESVIPENPYYNYLHVAELWASVFENIHVREYRRDRLVNGDICADFFDLMGLDDRDLEACAPENEALDIERLEGLRFVNLGLTCRTSPTWQFAQVDASEVKAAAELREQFGQREEGWNRSRDVRDLILREMRSSGRSVQKLLGEAEREQIRERFAEANRELSRKYIYGGLSDAWFPRKNPNDRSYGLSAAPLEPRELNDVLRKIVVALARVNAEVSKKLVGAEAEVSYLRSQLLRVEDQCTELKLELEQIHNTTTWRTRKKILRLGEKVRGKRASPRPRRGQESFH